MSDDIKKELADLERAEKELRRMKQELEKRETEIKRKLLAGATIEPGAFYAELRLLRGRDPNSKNPDDYDLIVSVVL